ncbi:MAG TPA: hypothetical protein VEH77_06245, partial [Roseiarcus sp.]|nr:hypothetical protein [Roseiarcus sp.]
MILSDNFFKAIAKHLKKVVVGVQDCEVGREIDHGLRPIDRVDPAFVIGGAHFCFGHVGRD